MKKIISIGIAIVWLANGLFCKLLNLVPRHQLIVSRILGEEYSSIITKAIGALEILMAVWILSGIKPRWCAVTQMFVVALMNILEFMLVPDLLLFGRFNSVFAVLFIVIININEFGFGKITPNVQSSKHKTKAHQT